MTETCQKRNKNFEALSEWIIKTVFTVYQNKIVWNTYAIFTESKKKYIYRKIDFDISRRAKIMLFLMSVLVNEKSK